MAVMPRFITVPGRVLPSLVTLSCSVGCLERFDDQQQFLFSNGVELGLQTMRPSKRTEE